MQSLRLLENAANLLIQDLETLALFKEILNDIFDENTRSNSNDIIDLDTTELLALVRGTRYLERRHPVPKSRHWLEEVLPNLDPERYRQQMRVSCEAFRFILNSIENHDVTGKIQLITCA